MIKFGVVYRPADITVNNYTPGIVSAGPNQVWSETEEVNGKILCFAHYNDRGSAYASIACLGEFAKNYSVRELPTHFICID
jgi:hypothetical protein